MEFRWAALIAVWTLISGPIMGVPSTPVSASKSAKVAVKRQEGSGHKKHVERNSFRSAGPAKRTE
jgi:hypothetical protein